MSCWADRDFTVVVDRSLFLLSRHYSQGGFAGAMPLYAVMFLLGLLRGFIVRRRSLVGQIVPQEAYTNSRPGTVPSGMWRWSWAVLSAV